MKSLATSARITMGIVMLAVVALWASPAKAQYTIAAQVGETSYTPLAFAWGPAGGSSPQGVSKELTLTLVDDATSVSFMQAAESKQIFATADVQAQLMGTSAVTIHMTGVRIHSVRIVANTNATLAGCPACRTGQPLQMITLRFDSVDYTFQPLNPVGQKSGPPVTFSATFR